MCCVRLGDVVWGTLRPSGGRCVRTLLPALRQELPPHGRLLRSPPGRLGKSRGLHTEDGGQGSARMAEDLDPEIGEAGARLLDGDPATPATQRLAGQPDMAADAAHQGLERQPGTTGGLGRLYGAPECFDELAGAQDPLIAEVGLPAPPETLDRHPAPETAQEAAPLKVGPAAPRDALGHEGLVGLPGPAAGTEVGEDCLGRLPGPGDHPQKGAVAGPGIPIQTAEVRDDLRAQRIEVEISHEATAGIIPSSRRSPSTTPSIRCTA